MNEFTAHGDKGGTRILQVPPTFRDSLLKALKIRMHYAQIFLLPRLFTIRFITQLNKIPRVRDCRTCVNPASAPLPPRCHCQSIRTGPALERDLPNWKSPKNPLEWWNRWDLPHERGKKLLEEEAKDLQSTKPALGFSHNNLL